MYSENNISNLPKTSSITIKKMVNLGIKTYFDLINYFPSRYDSLENNLLIKNVKEEGMVTVKGKIIEFKNQYTRFGKTIQKAKIQDETGIIDLIWFNQPFLLRVIYPNQFYSISGKIKKIGNKNIINVKNYEKITNTTNETIHTGRLIPVYSEKNKLSSKLLREKIIKTLEILDKENLEFLPNQVILENKLISENSAYKKIHFPKDLNDINLAYQRLAFDELFIIQLNSLITKKNWEKKRSSISIDFNKFSFLLNTFINSLEFKLTHSQIKVLSEIYFDINKKIPMNRLLQGDVGSGKTIIASIIAYLTFLSGYKTLIMAPTEILANQHFNTIKKYFNKIKNPPKIGLFTHSSKTNKAEEYDILIGTHALLFKNPPSKVGLIVIDEQHKFGVEQRANLKLKGLNPHLLTMTATPIPRTIMLTLYKELDISIIEEAPQNRLPIKTYYVNNNKRSAGYEWIKKEINKNKTQVYIICPLIEETENETLKNIKAVQVEFEILKKDIFPEFKLGLLHGKIKPSEKEKIMKDFKENKVQILVATPIVEVGVDIPNATIIIIENSDRFGLAQLHQLRGRVGRGDKQSYCFLFSQNENENFIKKMNFFCQNNNGLKLAEYDLFKRGAGELFGTKQHGKSNLKIAKITDFKILEKVNLSSKEFINKFDLKDFPNLKKRLENYKINLISND